MTHAGSGQPLAFRIVAILGLSLLYFFTAKAGLSLAFVQANASPVWPAAGVSLAALLILGARTWPGIFIGALLANLTAQGTSWKAAALIALGNTLAAAVAAVILEKTIRFEPSMERWKDIFGFLGIGVFLSPLLSATNGTLQVVLWNMAPTGLFSEIWYVWYSGDAMGVLLTAPPLLVWWGRRRYKKPPARPRELLVLLSLTLAFSYLVFWREVSGLALGTTLSFLVFPFAAWAAARHGLHVTTAITFLISAVALLGTIHRGGPFAAAGLHGQLYVFQLFVTVLAVTSMLLAGLVEERIRFETALGEAKERAEAADRTKSAFLATMSHEMRTPLNSIIGFTGILQRELAGPLNAEQLKQLGMVRGSAEHLLSVITNVLELATIEAGQFDLSQASFDLRACIEDCVERSRRLAKRKGLELHCENVSGPLVIVSDRRRVEQILHQLIQNAIKFTDSGEVFVLLRASGDGVKVSVSDTGIGIQPADINRLFLPFQQLESGLSRRFEGSGLGLVLCKKLIEKLGGTITVKSEPGRGSLFEFNLPLGMDRGNK